MQPSPIIRSVAIVGGGFSGALQAINLVRHQGPRAILIERRPQAGPGVAYTAAHPSLLLNVRAGNMSALPDEPDHLVRWLARRGQGDAGDFVSRVTYGAYLAELLDEVRRSAPQRLEIVGADVVALHVDADGVSVRLADGRAIAADAAVLALGNLPPAHPEALDPAALPPRCYVPDPWAADFAEGLGADDEVLAIGTGLTMVDIALLLDARGFKGRITALSRRGLLPRPHAAAPPVEPLGGRPPLVASALLRAVRGRARTLGWRAAIDELRPHTQRLWLAASLDRKLRFLRHLRPWWDVHRHRMAPPIADRVDALRREGRLRIVSGRILGAGAFEDRARVIWQPRGTSGSESLVVRRVINCTGPRIDLGRTAEPLLTDLGARGAIVADPLCLGISVDAQARVIAADGKANPRLFALGPMTRGTFWEVTAVPDIRVQTWNLARLLSNAHWVEGEGL